MLYSSYVLAIKVICLSGHLYFVAQILMMSKILRNCLNSIAQDLVNLHTSVANKLYISSDELVLVTHTVNL